MNKNTIKITKSDKFVWKVVTFEQAIDIVTNGLFSLYALHEDDSESLISDIAELQEYQKDGVEFGIEVGFINYREVEELKSLLKSHDYTYQYSDDGRAYRRGADSLNRIHELSKQVDRADFIKWWNRQAPEMMQMKS